MVRTFHQSDDGAVTSEDLKVVEAYENKSKDPLAKMRFPYEHSIGFAYGIRAKGIRPPGWVEDCGEHEHKVLIAAANLMPLIEELFKYNEKAWPKWRAVDTNTSRLLLEYEKVRDMAVAL